MFYYTYNSVIMYCTQCAIYSTESLTQGWQMISECDLKDFFIVRRESAPLVCVAMRTRAASYAARPQRVNDHI